jgi:hypothetical protein
MGTQSSIFSRYIPIYRLLGRRSTHGNRPGLQLFGPRSAACMTREFDARVLSNPSSDAGGLGAAELGVRDRTPDELV